MYKTTEFSKTKILCTLGPATNTKHVITELINNGMDGIRFNLSHGNYAFFENLFKEIEKTTTDLNTSIAILLDLQGPKIRIGELAIPQIELISGEKIEITVKDVLGTKELISTSYKALAKDAEVGDQILINDGLIRLSIIEKKENSVICYVEIGGTLKPKKGMNLPGMKLSTPSVTEKDFQDLEFAKKFKVDYIALSFVRKAEDIINLRKWLVANDFDRPIIAKIEKKEAIDNFDTILNVADGIMVARGDLGVELPPHEVPSIQKNLIKMCNAIGKPVITATQMLESMIENPIPTRAEASDVANAVWDGTDVVMLSGETSVGKYPIKAVQMMHNIVLNAEKNAPPVNEKIFKTPLLPEQNVFDSISKAVVSISRQIKAKAIIAFTLNGKTAINLAKYRPNCKIIAISNNYNTMNKLSLSWGITSVYMPEINKEHLAIDKAKEIILNAGLLNKGDQIIVTAGTPNADKSRSNWIKYDVV